MDFKGSKGNWDISQELVNGVEHVCIREQKEYDSQNNRLVSLISPVCEYDERDFYNAKLIMCAPEMIKMLALIRDKYLTAHAPESIFDELESLISKATE